MNDPKEFLDFIEENIDDKRININKDLKYGFKYYYIEIKIPTIHGHNLNMIFDTKHSTFKISYGYNNSLVYESKEIVDYWCNILEDEYVKRVDQRFESLIGGIIEDTEPAGKDFWRNWTMNKLFKK